MRGVPDIALPQILKAHISQAALLQWALSGGSFELTLMPPRHDDGRPALPTGYIAITMDEEVRDVLREVCYEAERRAVARRWGR